MVEGPNIVAIFDSVVEGRDFSGRGILAVEGRKLILHVHNKSPVKIIADVCHPVVIEAVCKKRYAVGTVLHTNIFPQSSHLCVSIVVQVIPINEKGISLLHPDVTECLK